MHTWLTLLPCWQEYSRKLELVHTTPRYSRLTTTKHVSEECTHKFHFLKKFITRDNKCIRTTISRIINIKLLGSFQLALDQSPRVGKERSYKLKELFQLQRLTAEMHLWRQTIAAQVIVANSVMAQEACNVSELLSRMNQDPAHSNQAWVWEPGLGIEFGTCSYDLLAKDLAVQETEITTCKTKLELINKCSKETCIQEPMLRGTV